MKFFVLIVAVLVLGVVAYMNRRLLSNQAERSYHAASDLVTGKESGANGPEETAKDAKDKTASGKKTPAGSRPAKPSSQNTADQSTASSTTGSAGASPGAGTSPSPSTDVMIVRSGSSIGDAESSAVFGNARVYTTYIEMTPDGGAVSEWTLQYALLESPASSAGQSKRNLRSVRMEAPVRAPIPIRKEYPQFPPEVVARNPGGVVLVYSVINAAGEMEQTRLLPNSDPALSQSVLKALQNWRFQPAQVNGSPVAVKSLWGIVLPSAG